jgi:hypothetical protein
MRLDTVKMTTEFTDDQPFDPTDLQMHVVELPVPRPFWRLGNFYYRGKLGLVDVTPVSTKLLSVDAGGSITGLSSVGGGFCVVPPWSSAHEKDGSLAGAAETGFAFLRLRCGGY